MAHNNRWFQKGWWKMWVTDGKEEISYSGKEVPSARAGAPMLGKWMWLMTVPSRPMTEKCSQKYSVSFIEADTMSHEKGQCFKFKNKPQKNSKRGHMHMYILKVGRDLLWIIPNRGREKDLITFEQTNFNMLKISLMWKGRNSRESTENMYDKGLVALLC